MPYHYIFEQGNRTDFSSIQVFYILYIILYTSSISYNIHIYILSVHTHIHEHTGTGTGREVLDDNIHRYKSHGALQQATNGRTFERVHEERKEVK